MSLPASHKVDQLEFVSSTNNGLTPSSARQNLQITFHGHTVGGQLQPFEERVQGQALRDFLALAVKINPDQTALVLCGLNYRSQG
jgi:hypothetical protein